MCDEKELVIPWLPLFNRFKLISQMLWWNHLGTASMLNLKCFGCISTNEQCPIISKKKIEPNINK